MIARKAKNYIKGLGILRVEALFKKITVKLIQ